jgi:hypothetical protein
MSDRVKAHKQDNHDLSIGTVLETMSLDHIEIRLVGLIASID